MSEIESKLNLLRESLTRHSLAGIRLRGVDWFSWITAGGSSVVILTTEIGVAEVLITPARGWVLTNVIEAERLRRDEVPLEFEMHAGPWQSSSETEALVSEETSSGIVASDRPREGEVSLPAEIVAAKRRLLPQEIERYRALGKDTASAMRETLVAAEPDWTEWRLAGEGARRMWERGIHPTLCLAAGEDNISRDRHCVPTSRQLKSRAMLVFCGRRNGLYANLTRLIFFRPPTEQARDGFAAVNEIQHAAWDSAKPGARLSEVYASLKRAYRSLGFENEISKHHQGGTTGYLSREAIATPESEIAIEEATAMAWNPSIPGLKAEETVLTLEGETEVLTLDDAWPSFSVNDRQCADFLVRT